MTEIYNAGAQSRLDASIYQQIYDHLILGHQEFVVSKPEHAESADLNQGLLSAQEALRQAGWTPGTISMVILGGGGFARPRSAHITVNVPLHVPDVDCIVYLKHVTWDAEDAEYSNSVFLTRLPKSTALKWADGEETAKEVKELLAQQGLWPSIATVDSVHELAGNGHWVVYVSCMFPKQ